MEVKIGVKGAPRELVVESDLTADDVVATVSAALADGGILRLEDSRGRQVLVPADRLAFVEIGEQEARRVGFGAM